MWNPEVLRLEIGKAHAAVSRVVHDPGVLRLLAVRAVLNPEVLRILAVPPVLLAENTRTCYPSLHYLCTPIAAAASKRACDLLRSEPRLSRDKNVARNSPSTSMFFGVSRCLWYSYPVQLIVPTRFQRSDRAVDNLKMYDHEASPDRFVIRWFLLNSQCHIPCVRREQFC